MRGRWLVAAGMALALGAAFVNAQTQQQQQQTATCVVMAGHEFTRTAETPELKVNGKPVYFC